MSRDLKVSRRNTDRLPPPWEMGWNPSSHLFSLDWSSHCPARRGQLPYVPSTGIAPILLKVLVTARPRLPQSHPFLVLPPERLAHCCREVPREEKKRCRFSRRGFILIAVMIVITMLCYSAYEFTHWISVETESAAIQVHEVQARYMAESGVALVEAMSLAKARGKAVPEPANYAELFEAIAIPLSAEDFMPTSGSTSAEMGRFTVFCSPAIKEESNPSGMNEKLVRFGTEPESARIHVNFWMKANPALLETALLALPGSSKELVDAILDWMDADNNKRPSARSSATMNLSSHQSFHETGPLNR